MFAVSSDANGSRQSVPARKGARRARGFGGSNVDGLTSARCDPQSCDPAPGRDPAIA